MTFTLIGQAASTAGHIVKYDRAGNAEHSALPAVGFLRRQPVGIPLQLGHDGDRIGTVRYLERSAAGGLVAVATVDHDHWAEHLTEFAPFYMSAGVRCVPTGRPLELGHAMMRELSIVKNPGGRCLRPVLWSPIDLGGGGGDPAGMPLAWHDTWARAHERAAVERYRVRPEHLAIHDVDELGFVDEYNTDPAGARQRLEAELEARTAGGRRVRVDGELLDGRRSARLLDVLDRAG